MNKLEKSKTKTIADVTSKYDPGRKTVGAIYREAQINNKDEKLLVGDLSNSLINSLVEDLNNTIESNPFDGKSFYITVHEKKDLQMKRCLLRRMIVSRFRPFPEDDSIVFYVEPRSNKVDFCWCLPHHTEIANTLINSHQYDESYICDVKAFHNANWKHFGFSVKLQQVVDTEVNQDRVIA